MSIDPVGIRISGPLAGFAEGYGTELAQLGYVPASVRLQLKVLADLSDWLSIHGMVAADLRRSDVDRFLRHRRAAGHTRYASIRAVRPVLDYLQRFEVVPRQAPDSPGSGRRNARSILALPDRRARFGASHSAYLPRHGTPVHSRTALG